MHKWKQLILCPALIERARARCAGWSNVRVIEGDATSWKPDAPADCVYFSYALTMILPYLLARTERACLHESSAPVPYLCGLRAPYFVYVGRKADSPAPPAPC